MGNIKVSKEKIRKMHTETQTFLENVSKFITDTENGLDSIKTNWEGKKSKAVLNNIDTIKNKHKELVLKIEENIVYLNSVVEVFESAENGPIESSTKAPSTQNMSSPTPTPPPTIEPDSSVQPLGPIPTVMPEVPKPTISLTSQTIKMDTTVIGGLGLKSDKNGNLIRVGNAYVGSYGGMDYLLNIPLDANGNIITNSPVIMEFHGSGEAGKNMNITRMPQDRMGLREIASNPNVQAIYIMPQVKNPNYYASEFSQIDAVKNNVINTLGADSNNIVAYGHSAGATGGMKYIASYPDGIKMYISIDGRPTSEFVNKIRDKKIPLLFVNSNAGNNVSYNVTTNQVMKSYPEYQNLTYDIKDQNFKADVGTAIGEMMGTDEIRAIYLRGSTHSTVRDATLNREVYDKIYEFFDIKTN